MKAAGLTTLAVVGAAGAVGWVLKPRERRLSWERSSIIENANAKQIRDIIMDFRNGHPHILPKGIFFDLKVLAEDEKNVAIQFKSTLYGSTRSCTSIVSEDIPNKLIVEREHETGYKTHIKTSFKLDEQPDNKVKVTIHTEMNESKWLLQGWLEYMFAAKMFAPIYDQELQLLQKELDKRNAK
jgi:hypothetical protein